MKYVFVAFVFALVSGVAVAAQPTDSSCAYVVMQLAKSFDFTRVDARVLNAKKGFFFQEEGLEFKKDAFDLNSQMVLFRDPITQTFHLFDLKDRDEKLLSAPPSGIPIQHVKSQYQFFFKKDSSEPSLLHVLFNHFVLWDAKGQIQLENGCDRCDLLAVLPTKSRSEIYALDLHGHLRSLDASTGELLQTLQIPRSKMRGVDKALLDSQEKFLWLVGKDRLERIALTEGGAEAGAPVSIALSNRIHSLTQELRAKYRLDRFSLTYVAPIPFSSDLLLEVETSRSKERDKSAHLYLKLSFEEAQAEPTLSLVSAYGLKAPYQMAAENDSRRIFKDSKGDLRMAFLAREAKAGNSLFVILNLTREEDSTILQMNDKGLLTVGSQQTPFAISDSADYLAIPLQAGQVGVINRSTGQMFQYVYRRFSDLRVPEGDLPKIVGLDFVHENSGPLGELRILEQGRYLKFYRLQLDERQ